MPIFTGIYAGSSVIGPWFGNTNIGSSTYVDVSMGVSGIRYTWSGGADPNFTGELTISSNVKITSPNFSSGNCGYGPVVALTSDYFEVDSAYFPNWVPESDILIGISGLSTGFKSSEVKTFNGIPAVVLPFNHWGNPVQSYWDRMTYPKRPITGKFDLEFGIIFGSGVTDWGLFLGTCPSGVPAPDWTDPEIVIGHYADNRFLYYSGVGGQWIGHIPSPFEEERFRTMRGYHITSSGTREENTVDTEVWGSANVVRSYYRPQGSSTWVQFDLTNIEFSEDVNLWIKQGPNKGLTYINFEVDGGIADVTTDSLTKSGYVWVNTSACFNAFPLFGARNLDVTFDSSCTLCTPTGWLWDFGDGSPTETGENPTHTYTQTGFFDVTLQVWSSGTTDLLTKSDYIYVYDADNQPVQTAPDNTYRVILTNKYAYPYKLNCSSIISKVDVINDKKLSYVQNVPIDLWLNWSGYWFKQAESSTGRFGNCVIYVDTKGVAPITNCLGIAVAHINGYTYVSNIIRYNFYS